MSDQVWNFVQLKKKILAANKETNVVILATSQQKERLIFLKHLLSVSKVDLSEPPYWIKFVSPKDPIIKNQPYKTAVLQWSAFVKNDLKSLMKWCSKSDGVLGIF